LLICFLVIIKPIKLSHHITRFLSAAAAVCHRSGTEVLVSPDNLVPEPGYVQPDVLPVNPSVEKSMAGMSHRAAPPVGSGNAARAHIFDHRPAVVGMHEQQEGHKCHVQRADVEAGLLVRVSDLSRAALMDTSRSTAPPSSPADHGGRRGPPLSAMEGPRGASSSPLPSSTAVSDFRAPLVLPFLLPEFDCASSKPRRRRPPRSPSSCAPASLSQRRGTEHETTSGEGCRPVACRVSWLEAA
jgi:hypothetical protein